jgi:hypothetical protein
MGYSGAQGRLIHGKTESRKSRVRLPLKKGNANKLSDWAMVIVGGGGIVAVLS